MGDHVTELIAGPAGLMSPQALADHLGNVVHPHPTMSETIMEAAHALCGHAIHM